MKKLMIAVLLGALSLATTAEESHELANEIPDGMYEAFPAKDRERFTPTAHICWAHCGIRSVQETRIHCEVVDNPAHIGGQGPSWEIHEETSIVKEYISVSSTCNETLRRRVETPIAGPMYWPEDDIWNPVSYEETGLTRFNCANLAYDPQANRTEDFVYRIVFDYQFDACNTPEK